MATHKLKVLCLHGFSQNKDVFKMKLGSLRKALKNLVDFEFIDGPLVIAQKREDANEGEARAWWLTEDHNKGEGFTTSVDLIKKYLEEMGPFDGILGFSQGAALLGLISSFVQNKKINAPSIKFVILIAGYKFKMHEDEYTEITLPSLHVIGDTDTVIVKGRSEELKKQFLNVELISHDGGHYVPASQQYRSRYVEFLEKFKQQIN